MDKKTTQILIIVGIILAVIILPKLGLFAVIGCYPPNCVSYSTISSVTWGYDDSIGQYGEFETGSMYINNAGYDDKSGNQWEINRVYFLFSVGNTQIENFQSKEISNIKVGLASTSRNLECGSGNLDIIKFTPPDGSDVNLNPSTESEIIQVFNKLDYETAEKYGTLQLPLDSSTGTVWLPNISLTQQAIIDFKLLNQRSAADWVLGVIVEEPTNIPSQCDQNVRINGAKFYIEVVCNPADTNCDNIVDRTELMAHITKWLNNQVTRQDLMNTIVAWLSS